MNDADYSTEIWKAIPGYEGEYEVSSFGRVRSLPRTVVHRWKSGDRTHRIPGKLLRGKSCGVGYWGVSLGRKATRYVHRLVCEAFHGTPPSADHQAAHMNGVRNDNRAENLIWTTRLENETHKIAHGTRTRGERHGSSILTDEKVLAMRKARKDGEKVCEIARKYGLNPTTAADAIRGKRWSHVPV